MPPTASISSSQQAFDRLSIWLDRQDHLQRGSDFHLADHSLNEAIRITFEHEGSELEIDAFASRVSLVHLSCMTTQSIPVGQPACIHLKLPGSGVMKIDGRIVFCSMCIPGIHRAGVVFDWESLSDHSSNQR